MFESPCISACPRLLACSIHIDQLLVLETTSYGAPLRASPAYEEALTTLAASWCWSKADWCAVPDSLARERTVKAAVCCGSVITYHGRE
jgi:hypothetical protein